MSTVLQATTNAQLQQQLASTHETSAPISSGGSMYGFASMVFTDAHLLASAFWAGYDTPSWLLSAGLSSDSFNQEAPEGRWLGPWAMKATPHDTQAAEHYLYHISIVIMSVLPMSAIRSGSNLQRFQQGRSTSPKLGVRLLRSRWRA